MQKQNIFSKPYFYNNFPSKYLYFVNNIEPMFSFGTNLQTGAGWLRAALRKGTKEAEQKGQQELRLESSGVQPAMISSS